jgi:hypothetical protein
MILLIVDALGWELAGRDAGFAPALTQRRRIETILGFSSGALPTLFSGRMPQEHGRWLMYRRASRGTPFAGFEWTRRLPARIRRSATLARALTRAVGARGVRGYFHLYEVPRWLLPQFDLAERDDLFRPAGLPVDMLWDTFERRALRWRGWNWRTPESENFAALERRAASGDESVLVCYTPDLDALLHREGSGGPGVRAALDRYTELVARLARPAAGATPWIYLLSDHGMVDVRATTDVMARLERLKVSWPDDYLAFFDSTMARFWWRTPSARREVETALADCPGGRWLDPATLAREGVLFPDHDYGESVFLLDPGVLMVPSFMGTSPLRAMHGYDPGHPDMAAVLLSNRPVPERVRHLREVRGFLESELEAMLAEAA